LFCEVAVCLERARSATQAFTGHASQMIRDEASTGVVRLKAVDLIAPSQKI
jgi:hypothetical protein